MNISNEAVFIALSIALVTGSTAIALATALYKFDKSVKTN